MMTKLKYIIPTIIAVAIVIISTISIIQFINRKRYNPVKVLNEVKSYFMNVKGSYIVYEPFVHPETDKYRLVYQGGITTIKMVKIFIMIFMQMHILVKSLTL